jgi:hypothetical protein
MTKKKNDNTTGASETVGSKGQAETEWNPEKSGKTQGGSQMGGKTSPAGGPETFSSDETNQGRANPQANQDRANQGNPERGNPYPPSNPDRPVMGGQQGGGGIGGPQVSGGFGKGATTGAEEEE